MGEEEDNLYLPEEGFADLSDGTTHFVIVGRELQDEAGC